MTIRLLFLIHISVTYWHHRHYHTCQCDRWCSAWQTQPSGKSQTPAQHSEPVAPAPGPHKGNQLKEFLATLSDVSNQQRSLKCHSPLWWTQFHSLLSCLDCESLYWPAGWVYGGSNPPSQEQSHRPHHKNPTQYTTKINESFMERKANIFTLSL